MELGSSVAATASGVDCDVSGTGQVVSCGPQCGRDPEEEVEGAATLRGRLADGEDVV